MPVRASGVALAGLAALASIAGAAGQQNHTVLLGRGDSLYGWGGGGLALNSDGSTVPWSGLPFFNLSVDFSGGGWFSMITPPAGLVSGTPQQLAFRYAAFRPANSSKGPQGVSL